MENANHSPRSYQQIVREHLASAVFLYVAVTFVFFALSMTLVSRAFYRNNLEDLSELIIQQSRPKLQVGDDFNTVQSLRSLLKQGGVEKLTFNIEGERELQLSGDWMPSARGSWINRIDEIAPDLLSSTYTKSFSLFPESNKISSVSLAYSNLGYFKLIAIALLIGLLLIMVFVLIAIKVSNKLSEKINLPIQYFAQILKDYDPSKSSSGIKLDPKLITVETEETSRLFFDLQSRIAKQTEQIGQLKTSAALTELASQVAHDIRSPLAALEVVAKSITGKSEEGTRGLVLDSIKRIRAIADDLLLKRKVQQQSTSIHDILSQVIKEKKLEYSSERSVEISYKPSGDAVSSIVSIDSTSFARVISNLINNAVAAADPGKKCMVTLTLNKEKSQKSLKIEVEDNGVGVPHEILRNFELGMFDFRSKGNGLGLKHAHSVLREANGSIELVSQKGKTVFTLVLPLCDSYDPQTKRSKIS